MVYCAWLCTKFLGDFFFYFLVQSTTWIKAHSGGPSSVPCTWASVYVLLQWVVCVYVYNIYSCVYRCIEV